ncbi:Lrp/AsnC family transcriptional regulator [Sphingobium sp. EM0848]|uniref:Lrp/AsnC family transcriptional regulator n=1 Tax=Sphingobium sp. EM0848 TaxID=2743473 RepID=UPI00159C6DB7|nr:Lrp/AsnC family transcriptional regulator [Sphingobium sp. EM0848]
MNEGFSIDEIDRKIIGHLRRNGRSTNQQIAESLDLTAATVSGRIRRMEQSDKLNVVAVSDFAAHGLDVLIQMAIEVDGRAASDVADELATLPEVFAVFLVTGRHNIDLLLALREYGDLPNLMIDKLSKIRGVRTMRPSIVLDVIKYQFESGPLVSGGGA